MLLRHAGGKSVHKIEILLLFTFQHSLREKKKWKAFYPGVSLILTTPPEAGKGQDHYSCYSGENTEKPREVRYLVEGDTQLLGAWREENRHTNLRFLTSR